MRQQRLDPVAFAPAPPGGEFASSPATRSKSDNDLSLALARIAAHRDRSAFRALFDTLAPAVKGLAMAIRRDTMLPHPRRLSDYKLGYESMLDLLATKAPEDIRTAIDTTYTFI